VKEFNRVYEMSQEHKVNMRTEACIIAVRRIADAAEKFDLFP